MEYVRYRFGSETGIGLQNVLFTNEMRAYYRRKRRRITRVSVRRRAQKIDMENALLENADNVGAGPIDIENPMINENPHQEERQQEPTQQQEEMQNQNPVLVKEPQPIALVIPDEIQQSWERFRQDLKEITNEAVRNLDALLNSQTEPPINEERKHKRHT
ncbi:hypothetical protein PTKIN_Ptkin05aG0149500 [Pterospermum kingtungense]